MTVEITLTTIQVDATTFDLYSNVDGYAVAFETAVSAASLQAGYTSALVPDGTTSIRVQNVSASCTNYIDLVLVTTTTTTSSTTTTTTTIATVECNASTNSGGVGVTEFTFDLFSYGGTLIMDFNAQSVPDKLEILHNGVRVATSGMVAANSGPFDTLYGDPLVPTSAQASATDQFIGSSKGVINNRNAEFLSDTGIPGITANRQQLIWFTYTNAEYLVNPQAVVRVTGPTGTGWNLDRQCQPDIALTDVIFNTSDSPTDLWQYTPSTMNEVFLFNAGVASSDVAHTENKLWVYNAAATELLEYDITLQPFTYTLGRTITNVFTNSGLCAIDDVTLVNIDGQDVYSLDITNAAAVPTLEFTMPYPTRFIAGDYVYTTGGKLIVSTRENTTTYIEQYDYSTGTLEFELDVTATLPAPYGMFQYNNELFIADTSGAIYNMLTTAPYTLSLVDTTSFTIFGASQVPSQITEEFASNTTTTTSTSSTTTTTTSSTSTTTTTTTAAPIPAYTGMGVSVGTVNEGSGATWLVYHENIPALSTIGWTITGIQSADLVGGLLTGIKSIGGTGTTNINVTVAEDFTTEGTETMTLTLDAVDSNGISAGYSANIIIQDSSTDTTTTTTSTSSTTTTTTSSTTTTTTTTVNPITAVSLSNSSIEADCGLTVNTGWFVAKQGAAIQDGDVIYDDAGGTATFAGNGNYYRMFDVDAGIYLTGTINVSGVCANMVLCP